jgi:hypothetical protein
MPIPRAIQRRVDATARSWDTPRFCFGPPVEGPPVLETICAQYPRPQETNATGRVPSRQKPMAEAKPQGSHQDLLDCHSRPRYPRGRGCVHRRPEGTRPGVDHKHNSQESCRSPQEPPLTSASRPEAVIRELNRPHSNDSILTTSRFSGGRLTCTPGDQRQYRRVQL